MKSLRILLPLALLVLLLVGCGIGKKEGIAVVNGEAISKESFEKTLESYQKVYKSSGISFEGEEGKTRLETLKKQVLDQLILRALETQEAEKRGIAPKDSDVKKRLEEIKKAYGKNFDTVLKNQNMSAGEYEETIKYQMIRDALYKDVTGKIKVDESDLQEHFKQNEADMVAVKARQILISFATHKESDAQKIAQDIIKQLASGKDFATLAREKSEDEVTKKNGGLMKDPLNSGKDVIRKNVMGGEMAKALFTLKPGQYSTSPVKTESGFVVLKVEESKKLTFNEVREDLRKQVLATKQVENYNKFTEELKKKAKIVMP